MEPGKREDVDSKTARIPCVQEEDKKKRRKQIFRDKRKVERGEIERDTKMQLRSYERACSIDQYRAKPASTRGRAATECYFCHEEPGSLRRLTLSQGERTIQRLL